VYGDELMKHHLSDQHPLQPIRVKLTMELIRSTGLIDPVDHDIRQVRQQNPDVALIITRREMITRS
jgi:acetoin utilization deacetylase AcuC-like enzyme